VTLAGQRHPHKFSPELFTQPDRERRIFASRPFLSYHANGPAAL
jgi:hypothetical protein